MINWSGRHCKSIVVMWQSYARKFVSRSDWENWVYWLDGFMTWGKHHRMYRTTYWGKHCKSWTIAAPECIGCGNIKENRILRIGLWLKWLVLRSVAIIVADVIILHQMAANPGWIVCIQNGLGCGIVRMYRLFSLIAARKGLCWP